MREAATAPVPCHSARPCQRRKKASWLRSAAAASSRISLQAAAYTRAAYLWYSCSNATRSPTRTRSINSLSVGAPIASMGTRDQNGNLLQATPGGVRGGISRLGAVPPTNQDQEAEF